MFQSFEPKSDKSFGAAHLPRLRAALAKAGVDAFIIPRTDEYQNEYPPECNERLRWATGFSGSAGDAVVFADRAILFVDGRYTLQVREETDGGLFEYEDLMENPPAKWLETNAAPGSKIAYDPNLHTKGEIDRLKKAVAAAGATLVGLRENPVDAAWGEDRPAAPQTPCLPHGLEFAGEAHTAKRARVGETVGASGADMALITAPDCIAWLLNVRGSDVARMPISLSRVVLHAKGQVELYIDPAKTSSELSEHLGNEVTIRPETDLDEALRAYAAQGRKIALDPRATPQVFYDLVESAGGEVVPLTDPCVLPRARKNEAEQAGARGAHERDALAVTRFLHWLSMHATDDGMNEIDAAKQLEAFRAEFSELRDLSFETISAFGPNGASPHYRVTDRSNLNFSLGTLYLVDSGAQYPDGTTDVTRTIAVGAPSEEMRERFTLVLKGHIALATLRFPHGVSGSHIDALARAPLWRAGLDFDHGTGHGVGSYLGVHEGPQRISRGPNTQALLPGMILSNEPGYYKPGEYGIRIENLVLVSSAEKRDSDDRAMLAFETLTLAPIDRTLIVADMLTVEERTWLDAYHARVRETLTPHLPDDVAAWLAEVTQPL